jgi:hypothetical protein
MALHSGRVATGLCPMTPQGVADFLTFLTAKPCENFAWFGHKGNLKFLLYLALPAAEPRAGP